MDSLQFPDDFEEFRARANSGGSLYGILKRQVLLKSCALGHQHGQHSDTAESHHLNGTCTGSNGTSPRQRSRSLFGQAIPVPALPAGEERCVLLALFDYAEERRRSGEPRRHSAAIDGRDLRKVVLNNALNKTLAPPQWEWQKPRSSRNEEARKNSTTLILPCPSRRSSIAPSPGPVPSRKNSAFNWEEPDMEGPGLNVPTIPVRKYSIPKVLLNDSDDEDELISSEDAYMLSTIPSVQRRRSFTLTPDGVVNQGDIVTPTSPRDAITPSYQLPHLSPRLSFTFPYNLPQGIANSTVKAPSSFCVTPVTQPEVVFTIPSIQISSDEDQGTTIFCPQDDIPSIEVSCEPSDEVHVPCTLTINRDMDDEEGDDPTTLLCRSTSFDSSPPLSRGSSIEESSDQGGGTGRRALSIDVPRISISTEMIADQMCPPNFAPAYRVLMLGGPGVGKTALTQQFMTSEYMAAQNTSFDDGVECSVPVLLDGEEYVMEFVDLPYTGHQNIWKDYEVDAYVVIFSIIDRRSFDKAKEFTEQVRMLGHDHEAIILVANKSDLVRGRVIDDDDGPQLARENRCKYIEVSAILNHKVDDLLVGILKQIRLSQVTPSGEQKERKQSLERQCSADDVTACMRKTKQQVLGRFFKQRLSRSCEDLFGLGQFP